MNFFAVRDPTFNNLFQSNNYSKYSNMLAEKNFIKMSEKLIYNGSEWNYIDLPSDSMVLVSVILIINFDCLLIILSFIK